MRSIKSRLFSILAVCGVFVTGALLLRKKKAGWGCKPKPRKFYNAFAISLLIRIQTLNPARNPLNRFGAKSV